MFSQLSCCDSFSWVDFKYSLKKIFNIFSTVFCYLLSGISHSLALADILSLPAEFLIPPAPVQMRIKLYIAKNVLKGNSIFSIKKKSTPNDQISISQPKNKTDD